MTDTPDWQQAFTGTVNTVAQQEVVFPDQAVTLPSGDTAINMTVPKGVLSLAVQLNPNISAFTGEMIRFEMKVTSSGLIYPPSTVDTYVGNDRAYPCVPVYLDVIEGAVQLHIYNTSNNTVAGNLEVIGYGTPAAMVNPGLDGMAEEWAWVGWEASNLNAVNPSYAIHNVTFNLPVNEPMFLTGLEVDLSAAVNFNDSTVTFWEVLGLGGYSRKNSPAYTPGTDASNPANIAAPGFGTPQTESSTYVNWGPNAAPFPGGMFAVILKQSGSNPGGDDRHVSLASQVLLLPGDNLWFHMAAQTNGQATTATIDGEMQMGIRYKRWTNW